MWPNDVSVATKLAALVAGTGVSDYYANTTFGDYRVLSAWIGTDAMHTPIHGSSSHAAEYVARDLASGRLLEVGCGKGYNAGHLHDMGYHVDAVDLVPEHVAYATRAHPGPTYWVEDVTAPNRTTTTRTYDVVYGIESLCHVEHQDRPGFLRHARQRLRANGTLVVVDGFRSEHFSRASEWSRDAMRAAEAGFRITRMPTVRDWTQDAVAAGFRCEPFDDWTEAAVPFWRTARWIARVAYIMGLGDPGNVAASLAVGHALDGGAAVYGALTCRT